MRITFAGSTEGRLDGRHLGNRVFREALAGIVPRKESGSILDASVDLGTIPEVRVAPPK